MNLLSATDSDSDVEDQDPEDVGEHDIVPTTA